MDITVCGNTYNIKGVRALGENGNMVTYTPCGYDLIIEVKESRPLGSLTVNDIEIIEGDILDAEDKVANGLPVNGLFITNYDWSWTPSGVNSNKYRSFLPLTEWNCPYCHISFGAVALQNATDNYAITVQSVELGYDPDTGEITNVWSSFKLSSV